MNPNWRNRYLRYKSFFLNVVLSYKSKPQLRAYLEILLSFLTIGIFGVFAIKPTAVTIAQLLREIEVKKETIARMEEKIQNLEKAQSLFVENQDKIALIETAIPKKPNPDSFARQVEGLSGKNNVEILKVATSGGPILGQIRPPENSGSETVEGAPVADFPILGFVINMKVPIDRYVSLSEFTSDLLYKIRTPINIDLIRLDTQALKDNKAINLVINGRIPYNP